MANILVFPNLYNGSALTDVSLGLVRDIKKNNFDVKIVGFDLPMTTLGSGKLDDPEIFFQHNKIVLEKLKEMIEDGDKILFVDMFQLGLGLLKYYLSGTKKNVRLGALLHGASFIEGDFYKDDKWIKNFEMGMVDLMDVIYMPSEYYAEYFKKTVKNKKVKVLPFGFYPRDYLKTIDLRDKEYDVIFPHRWSWDKRPKYFYELAKDMPDIKFALCGDVKDADDKELIDLFNEMTSLKNVVKLGIKTDESHFEDLRKAKVVVAIRDSFGYGFRKAMACGCIPLVKNTTCFPEYIPEKYRFDTLDEAKGLIRKFVKDYPKDYIEAEEYSFLEILEDFFNGN